MDPVSLFSFALVVGFIALAITFAFSLSFYAGLIFGALGYALYSIIEVLHQSWGYVVSVFDILKWILLIYIIFMVISYFRQDKTQNEDN